MAFHDDLLKQATHLAQKEKRNPTQASLRRAVSAAYYALFHLLISESVANWSQPDLRGALSRAFDHQLMKAASNRLVQSSFAGEDPSVVRNLKLVAGVFVMLQASRHTADYDMTTTWTRIDTEKQVNSAQQAFAAWKSIRTERIAQAYLVSLIVKKRD
jgi:uncharacterized protein (UPF0332 family)